MYNTHIIKFILRNCIVSLQFNTAKAHHNCIFDDKEHIVYVNGAYVGEDDIGKLMHDFRSSNPDDMYYRELSERAGYFKRTEEGGRIMCEAVEKLIDEFVNSGKKDMLFSLIQKKAISLDDAAEELSVTPAFLLEEMKSEGYSIPK